MSKLPADLATWLEDQTTKRFLQWLNDQITVYRSQVPEYVVKGDMDKAKAAAGGLRAYEEILMSFEPDAEPVTVVERPFIDPATRLSLRKQ